SSTRCTAASSARSSRISRAEVGVKHRANGSMTCPKSPVALFFMRILWPSEAFGRHPKSRPTWPRNTPPRVSTSWKNQKRRSMFGHDRERLRKHFENRERQPRATEAGLHNAGDSRHSWRILHHRPSPLEAGLTPKLERTST